MQTDKITTVKAGYWLKIDAVICGSFGVLLFLFPSLVTALILNDKSDGVHWHLIRCCGAQMISEAFTWWIVSLSPEPQAKTSCFVARLTTSALCLAVSLHANIFYAKFFWSSVHLSFL